MPFYNDRVHYLCVALRRPGGVLSQIRRPLEKWTFKHAFFARMGGFELKSGPQVVSDRHLYGLCDNHIPFDDQEWI